MAKTRKTKQKCGLANADKATRMRVAKKGGKASAAKRKKTSKSKKRRK